MVMTSRRVLGRLAAMLLLACVLVVTHAPALHAYRKPPFNGSIFGKRAESEGTGRALASLCEVAAEACSAWFPSPPEAGN